MDAAQNDVKFFTHLVAYINTARRGNDVGFYADQNRHLASCRFNLADLFFKTAFPQCLCNLANAMVGYCNFF